MTPQTIANATRELGKPVDWDESKGECKLLAVRDETHICGNVMVSEWKLSADELRALNEGGSVLLYVVGKSHPPVSLDVLSVPVRGYLPAPDEEPCTHDQGAYSR